MLVILYFLKCNFLFNLVSGFDNFKNLGYSEIANSKKKLLETISITRKSSFGSTRIINAVLELENLVLRTSYPIDKVSGDWSLVYSTQIGLSQKTEGKENLVDNLTGRLYQTFFKVAPFLAGGQDTSNNYLFSDVIKVSNRQVLDTSKGVVNNTVVIKLPNGLSTKISVNGVLGESFLSTGSPVGQKDSIILPVEFSDFSLQLGTLPAVRLPLPRPKGQLRTTFCDGDLRISRGGRGGIFIAKKITR